MSSLVPVLQAIAADQVSSVRTLELGVVTEVFSNESGSGEVHPAVNARLRGSGLELHRVPVVVGRIGMSHVPQVGDLVVIGFLGGTLDAPLVLGSLYDEQNVPPQAAPDEILYAVPDAGNEGVHRVKVLVDDGKSITVEDGHVEIVMGSTSVTVESDGGVVIDAAGDISLSAGGDIVLEARGDVKASGVNVTLDGQAGASLKGAANAAVESSGATRVKGAAVTVAGVVQFSAG